jgi:hypothetical protein
VRPRNHHSRPTHFVPFNQNDLIADGSGLDPGGFASNLYASTGMGHVSYR